MIFVNYSGCLQFLRRKRLYVVSARRSLLGIADLTHCLIICHYIFSAFCFWNDVIFGKQKIFHPRPEQIEIDMWSFAFHIRFQICLIGNFLTDNTFQASFLKQPISLGCSLYRKDFISNFKTDIFSRFRYLLKQFLNGYFAVS